MGAVPSSSWLPILEAPGYLRHLTFTLRRSCLSKFFEKKKTIMPSYPSQNSKDVLKPHKARRSTSRKFKEMEVNATT